MMRICFTVSEMHTIGGVPQFVLRYAAALRGRGMDVSVIAGAPPPGAPPPADGVTTAMGLGRRFSLAGAIALLRAMRAMPRDTLFVSNSTNAALLTALAGRLLGRRCLYLAHGLASRFHRGPAFLALRTAELAAAFLSRGAIVLNRDDARLLARVTRVHPFTNGVEAPDAIPARAPAGGPLRLLCVARHEPQKNLTAMLRALGGCRIPFVLTIAGGGALLPFHQQLIEDLGLADRVSLAGPLAPDAIPWSAHDAFLLCSISEGMPLALLEAFAHGLPAIVTNAPGLGEYADDGLTGCVLPRLDAPALEYAIEAVQRDRAQLAEHAFAAARTRFSLERSVDRLVSILTQEAPPPRRLAEP
jgi:glycosyltransferase involved in cell wall biosynthesis